MSSREEFEAWYLASYPAPFGATGTEPSDRRRAVCLKEALFVAWQASREALVIELPQQSGVNRDWNQAIRYCHQAIEAAGVKVKP